MGLTPHKAAKDASVFSRSGLSPMVGQQAQGDVGGLGHGVLIALAVFAVERAEACAGAEQLAVAQAGQPFPQGRLG